MRSPGSRSERSVNPRKSEDQSTTVSSFTGPPPDLTGQDPRTGLWAEIGVEQIDGNPPLTLNIAHNRNALGNQRHILDLVPREPAGSVGHIGNHVIMVAAMGAADRQGEIVGPALSF